MKVALLEFIDEFAAFERYIKQKGLTVDDFLIVSLEPKLGAYLTSRGTSYRNTLPYFNSDSHRTLLVETEKIMEHIREHFTFIDENGLSHCYRKEFTHYIRLFVNHILKTIEILANMHSEKGEMELYASVTEEVSSDPQLSDSERYTGLLTRIFAESRGLRFTNINDGTQVSIPAEGIPAQAPSFIEQAYARALLWFLKKKKLILIPAANSPFNGLNPEIVSKNPDTGFLAIEFRQDLLKTFYANTALLLRHLISGDQPLYQVINPSFIPIPSQTGEKQALMTCIDDVTKTRAGTLFSYRDVDYSGMLIKKVERSLKPHLEDMRHSGYSLAHIFRTITKSFVMSFKGLGMMAVAGELARTTGKRSLFVSHGAHPVPVDSYHELELNTLSRTFMLGDYTHVTISIPVQEAHLHYFKDKYGDIDNVEIRTGPLIFADLQKGNKDALKKKLGLSPDTVVITHAVTVKHRKGERFYFLESRDEFIDGLADLVNAVGEIDSAVLLIRVHPGFYLNNDELRSLLPQSGKYIIHREGPFSDALGATDILVSYSSTAIDEAMMNGIPVLLFDKWNRYNHSNSGVYENDRSPDIFPTCYVNSGETLSAALRCMIEKIGTPDIEDIDVSRYRFREDYRENFFDFVKESLR